MLMMMAMIVSCYAAAAVVVQLEKCSEPFQCEKAMKSQLSNVCLSKFIRLKIKSFTWAQTRQHKLIMKVLRAQYIRARLLAWLAFNWLDREQMCTLFRLVRLINKNFFVFCSLSFPQVNERGFGQV